MSKDLSKQTVVVLAVLTILISLLGTFTVLREVGSLDLRAEIRDEPSQAGELRIGVRGEPQTSSSAGHVSLEVEEVNNNNGLDQ